MPISTVCSSCSAKLKVPDNLAGRKIKCPKCGSAVTTADTAIARAPATIKVTKPPASEPEELEEVPPDEPPPDDDTSDADEREARPKKKKKKKKKRKDASA